MMRLLVLGYVPGTDIQLTFNDVSNIVGGIAVIVLVCALLKQHQSEVKSQHPA